MMIQQNAVSGISASSKMTKNILMHNSKRHVHDVKQHRLHNSVLTIIPLEHKYQIYFFATSLVSAERF